MKIRMKTYVKGIALCLCICLLMAGCKSAEGEKSTTKTEGDQKDITQEKTDQEENNQEEHPYWLTEEKGKLTVWQEWGNDYLESLNDMETMQVMADLTNVDVTYTNVGQAEASEKYGLLLASGSLPDIIIHSTVSYPGGFDKAVAEGIFIDLKDYMETEMPHYKALRESDPEVLKDTSSDSGVMPVVYMLRANEYGELAEELPWAGLALRQDWLDDLGLSTPETIEDWDVTLTAFKEQKGADAPLLIGSTANFLYDSFLSAYGVLSSYYLEGDTVKFGPAEEGYFEYLKLMRDWYERGLINPNFMSSQSDFVVGDESFIATGRSGACHSISGFLGNTLYERGTATEESFNLVPVQNPVLKKGDTAQARCNASTKVSGTATAVTTSCKDVDLAVKWIDFHYSKKGMELISYGIEGKTFEIVDGKYTFTDMITNDPQMSESDMANQYSMGDGLGLISWGRSSASPDQQAKQSIWAKDETSLQLPNRMTLTEEEGNTHSFNYTAVQTAVQEYTLNFILGNVEESGFEAFVESLYGMGLEECLKCQQAAYDRYQAR